MQGALLVVTPTSFSISTLQLAHTSHNFNAQVQGALLAEAAAFRDANIVDVKSYEELEAAVAEGK